ncbi:MAG: hypothetical protein KDB79_13050 [Acidobacteria bacterium]|nr:hypothetical protein [Acidobacteriota bacterium]
MIEIGLDATVRVLENLIIRAEKDETEGFGVKIGKSSFRPERLRIHEGEPFWAGDKLFARRRWEHARSKGNEFGYIAPIN